MKYILDENGQMANPFAWNYIMMKKKREKAALAKADKQISHNWTAQQVMADPEANIIAKFLGIGSKTDIAEYYDKLIDVINWAIQKTGSKDVGSIIEVLRNKINEAPKMNDKPFIDLWCAVKLDLKNTANNRTQQTTEHSGNEQ